MLTNLAVFDSCLGQFNCFVDFGSNAKVLEESLDMKVNTSETLIHPPPTITISTSVLGGRPKTVPTLS